MEKIVPKVSVLILTYNRTDLLKACLDSALKSDYPNLEFIISDNESSEDIKGFIGENYSDNRIKVVRLKKNKGLTGGFNFGFKFCQGKYVMLLCNDTKIDKHGISKMVELAEADPEVGMVAPLVIQMRNLNFIHSAGSFLTNTGILYHYGVYQKKNNPKYQKSYYIFSSTGAGFLVRKETILKTGLYSEDFFMAYDESDLCHRVWLGGYAIVFCPQAVLQHYWSATMNSSLPVLWYWNHRNILSSFIINFSTFNVIRFVLSISLIWMFVFFHRLYKGKFKLALTIPQAYWWHILNLQNTIRQRRYIQKNVRKVSDKQLFARTMVLPGFDYYMLYFGKKNKDIKLPQNVVYKVSK